MAIKEFTPGVTEDEKTLATTPGSDLALPPRNYIEDDDAEGEFDITDERMPRIQIVAKTGSLADEFKPGTILLNKEVTLADKEQALKVIPVKMCKSFQEDIPYGSGIGDTVRKSEEVLARGGVLKYRPYNCPPDDFTRYWKPVLDILLLVEKPEHASEEASMYFFTELDGKMYMPARFGAYSKTQYTAFSDPLVRLKRAGKSISSVVFSLSTTSKNRNGNSWIQVNIRPFGHTSDAVKKFLAANPL